MDDDLSGLFEDLEQQADGLALNERDVELADRARGEYAQVSLASRVHASLGRVVVVDLVAGIRLTGELSRAGPDWLVVAQDGGEDWAVRLVAVSRLRGLSSRSVRAEDRPVTARLGYGSVLRDLSMRRVGAVVILREGDRLPGVLGRIGRDFLELRRLGDDGRVEAEATLLPLSSVAAVTERH